MCWTGKIQDHIKCVDADVKVFKIVRMDKGKILPYFQASLMPEGYEVGKRYQTMLSASDIRDDKTVAVFSGFHSYHCSNYLAVFTKGQAYIGPLPFSPGIATVYSTDDCAVMQCTIPKGAELFINQYGDVVSNEIFVDGIWRPSLFQRLMMRMFNAAYRAEAVKPMIT